MKSTTKRFVAGPIAVAASALMLLGATPQVAMADEGEGWYIPSDPHWYANYLGFDEIHSQGLTGKGVKIAVIDSQVNLDSPELKGANVKVVGSFCESQSAETDSTDSHGTSVVSMLVGRGPGTLGIVPDAEILFYGTGADSDSESSVCKDVVNPVTGKTLEEDPTTELGGDASAVSVAARQAIRDEVDVINVSMLDSDLFSWMEISKQLLESKIPLLAGTPNPSETAGLEHFGEGMGISQYPYKMNGVFAIGGLDNDRGYPLSDRQPEDVYANRASGSSNLFLSAPGRNLATSSMISGEKQFMHGTSLATPLVSGMVALGMEKYPDASGYQVLSALRDTSRFAPEGGGTPEWRGSELGYGAANPQAMLKLDPTQYPDENPAFVTRADDSRCTDENTGWNPVDDMDACYWASYPTAEAMAEYSSGPVQGEVSDDPDAVVKGVGILMVVTVLLVPLLVVGGIVFLVVFLAKRKRKRSAANSAPQYAVQHFDPASHEQYLRDMAQYELDVEEWRRNNPQG